MIDRHSICKNLSVQSLRLTNNNVEKKRSSYEDIIHLIDKCKTYLSKVKGAYRGQKVILTNFYWPEYLGWFYACAELGLSFVISDYPRSEVALKKLDIYGDIDWIIYDDHCPAGFRCYQDKIIDHQEIKNITPDYSIGIEAEPEDIILYATTSGTTGTPRVIEYTHQFFYDLMERNANLYQLKKGDKCFHSKNLHHGSVLGVYFLPTMKYCQNHYHAPFRYILIENQEKSVEEAEGKLFEAWVKMIQEEQINKVLLFFNQIDVFKKYLDINSRNHDDLTAFLLTKISQDDIDVLVKKFHYTIKSIFGSTETSGPLFLPEINSQNCNCYDPRNMGEELDNFYKLNLDDKNILNVTMPCGNVVSTGDKFEISNNEWLFKGRDNLYRVNGHPIYIDILNEVISKATGLKKEVEFDVIVDSDKNQIYIRSDVELNLNNLNQTIFSELGLGYYYISKQITGIRSKFFSGIKFDPQSIRMICRNDC